MRKKDCIICIGLVIILVSVASLSGCISGKKIYETTNEEYEVDENTILEVYNINGEVKISGYDGDKILLKILKFTNKIFGEDEFEKVQINVNEIDNRFIIETEYLEQVASVRVAVSLELQIPNYVTVENVETLNGAIYLSDVKGDVKSDVKNGLISICGVDGYVQATSANGAINIKDTTGVNSVSTINGALNVDINDIKQDIEITTTNGDIQVSINPGLNADLEVKINSIAGFIYLNDLLPYLNLTINTDRLVVGTIGEGENKIYIDLTTGIINLHTLN